MWRKNQIRVAQQSVSFPVAPAVALFKLTWRAASLERCFPRPHTAPEALRRANEGGSGCSKTRFELQHFEPQL